MGDLPGKDTLDDVGAIEAIHAVSAHHTCLYLGDAASLAVDKLSLTEANIEIGHEEAMAEHSLFDDVNKFRQIFPLHFLALPMEVKPHILDVFVLH